jgi:putative membrane protein
MNRRPSTNGTRLGLLVGGVLMGVADAIPGVSGGTVAMVLGIYDRLVTAISRCDTSLVRSVVRGRWREASDRIDLAFLFTLGLGIAGGILALASVMRVLLTSYPSLVNAVFFGLVAGSCVVVTRSVRAWTVPRAVLMVIAINASFVLVGFPQEDGEMDRGQLHLFCCGAVAICAMILPGVSGAFLMKVLGQYDRVIGMLSDVVHFQATSETLLALGVFACGCVFGLISFSKLIRWLLANVREATLAVLCGAMCGSLRALWPFDSEALVDGRITGPVLLMVAGFAAVLLLNRMVRPTGPDSSRPS